MHVAVGVHETKDDRHRVGALARLERGGAGRHARDRVVRRRRRARRRHARGAGEVEARHAPLARRGERPGQHVLGEDAPREHLLPRAIDGAVGPADGAREVGPHVEDEPPVLGAGEAAGALRFHGLVGREGPRPPLQDEPGEDGHDALGHAGAGGGVGREDAAPHRGAEGVGQRLEDQAPVLGHVLEPEVHPGLGPRGVLGKSGDGHGRASSAGRSVRRGLLASGARPQVALRARARNR